MFPRTKAKYIETIPSSVSPVLQGRRTTISPTAQLAANPLLETLEEMAAMLVMLDGRIKAILGEGAKKAAWESLSNGRMGFHLQIPKYRLQEVLQVLPLLT
ncbi:hypothetical protein BXZ70DRAFT_1008302 [Cristinia sonorae]|uniref:Uncharacterized protein n=1 Tax=Cristinia sonorae TaxID=1940300 RepID=A0A8K0UQ55_9AGAR|nr:hypothetical protein BXZ70DRAFT_1008302 [Cristinia sonorae]